MSLESLEAGAFDSAPITQEVIPVYIQEESHPLHNDTDRDIRESLEGAQSEIFIAKRTIETHTRLFHEGVSREEKKAIERAALDRILARRERDRQIDAIKAEFEQKVDEINLDEAEFLEGIGETKRHGDDFLAACNRVGETLLGGVAAHRETHRSLTTAIERITHELIQSRTNTLTVDDWLSEKINEREELLRQYEETQRMTRLNYLHIEKLIHESSETTEEQYRQRRGIENGVVLLTPEAINNTYSEMHNQEYAHQQIHKEIMMSIDAIHKKINEENIENAKRDENIKTLRYEIDALRAESEVLREKSATSESQLVQLDVAKAELERNSAILLDRAEALQAIARGGIGAIDTIPLELQDIVKAAIGGLKEEASQQSSLDFATAIPEMDSSVIRINVSPDAFPQVNMSKIAVQVVSAEAPSTPKIEVQESSIQDTVDHLIDEMNTLRQWVKDNAGSSLHEAARFISQGFATPGLRAHIRTIND